MTAADRQDKLRLGFLTAIQVPQQGFMGGLLVTNHLGRPLEFQCTNPVKPNRTQEVLYGPTLQPFVLAELIGKTLLEKAGVKPHIVFITEAALLELREHITACLAMVVVHDHESAKNGFAFGRQTLITHADYGSDRSQLENKLTALPDDVDLLEPFERVEEALRQATGGTAAA
ncbi:hypothetical protein [Symmachiella dynata]|uniref:hypothetical protein n=1 Tax=Symmachiella dynata TaxID=2527995 RepID=UPI0030ED0B31|tara:strand:- start:343 stop:861 length:519 start_codon:yes stop_codon:yes gene_type:complete